MTAVVLRDGTEVDDPKLDRLISPNFDHLDNYPLTMSTLPASRTAMVMGVNWYSNFDKPTTMRIRGRNRKVIGAGDLGRVRGGHATCLKHYGLRDYLAWWLYYNQGKEGRCVEFATLRAMTLHNRVRYDISSRWHYHQMQKIDYWAGGSYPGASPVYEGTSVDAGLNVMRKFGAIPALWRGAQIPLEQAPGLVRPEEGIEAFRWAQSWDMVRVALGVPSWMPGVPMLNSWGRGYPHEVILLDEAGARLLHEDGEFGMITDR